MTTQAIERVLFDFRGGIQNKRNNPLDVSENSFVDGLNVDLSDGSIRTRPGYSVVSSGSLPEGEVMALSQVRFPSTEISRLVAQTRDSGIAYEFPESQNPPGARVYHFCAYDPINNYIWVFGGRTPDDWSGTPAYYNDLWYWNCTTSTWHQVTGATNHPTWYAWSNQMVYDPTYARLILYIGRAYDSDGVWLDDVDLDDHWVTYTIGTNTWGEIEKGDPAFAPVGVSGWHENGRMVLVDRTLYLLGGWNGETMFTVSPIVTFNVDSGNYGGLTPTYDGDGPPNRMSCAAVAVGSASIYLVGGYELTDFWRYDITGNHWYQLDSLPLEVGDYFFEGSLCYCSQKFWAIGSASITSTEFPVLSDMAYVYFDGEWSQCQFTNEPQGRSYTWSFVVGTDIWLVLGASTELNEGTGDPLLIEGAELLSEMCEWEPAGGGAQLVTSRLYASSDNLPTTTATFEEIYDLGDADRVTFAVLNDRVVITEGRAAPPLVWGGCMPSGTTGADWMTLKAAMVTQDGDHFYDVTAQACDNDEDTIADIGLISAAGYLALCTDMSQVEAFYFDMYQVNTVDTEDLGNQQSVAVAFSSDAMVTVEDFISTIDDWVQDSGATGHFEDVTNTPLTLGPGNDCPDIETGLQVIFAATDATIIVITDDGEGSGEVELSATIGSQSVDSVIGLSADTGELTSPSGYSTPVATWSEAATAKFSGAGFSLRQILSAGDISTSGEYCRVSLTFPIPDGVAWTGTKFVWGPGTLRGSTNHPLAYTIARKMPTMISRISIGERDGSTANTTETPTPITFPTRPYWDSATGDYDWDTHPSFSTSTSDGNLYLTVCLPLESTGASYTITSDWIKFAIDNTKDYVLILDCMDVWGSNTARGCPLSRSAGTGYYYLLGVANAPETWNVADVSAYEFSYQSGYNVAIVEMDVRDRYPLPTQILVAHSTDASQLSLAGIENFRSLIPNQETDESSQIYHAVSLDARSTFQVYLSGVWRTIVKFDSVWKYLDGSDVWQSASEDTLLRALKEAFAISQNQMLTSHLEAMTSDEWSDTGGIVVRVTLTMDFAVGLLCDTDAAPVMYGYTAVYNDAGDTTIQGYSGNKWDAGDGWTDNTRLDDVPWGQDGTVVYDGTSPYEAQHYVLNEVPGFWYRFKSNGTAQGTAISTIRYKAPCQPLANIGDGQPDIPLAMIFHDTSADKKKDITIEVSGGQGAYVTDPSTGDVTYQFGKATIPMETTDYLYVGYILQFNQMEVTPYDGYENAVVSVMSGEYWDGTEWVSMDIVDDTVGDDTDNLKTLSSRGKINWFLPEDWKMHIPLDADFPRGYYVRFAVSANLTSTTALDEVRIYAVPDSIVKHKFAVAFRDRIALVSRPDAADQVDISRALEEYGFIGADSGSYRVGGMDSIQCAVSAWNGLFLAKTETLHQLLGQTPADFSWQGVEAARAVPVSARSCIKAPASGIGSDGSRYGLFFLNRFGAFVQTGLQVDSTYNSSRSQIMSESVDWWSSSAVPRIDLKNLAPLACGEYWPVKNWLVWSVPMILTSEQTEQTSNNRLIVFDLTLGSWLPPMNISVSAMCLAYDYQSGSPGNIGSAALLAGDYQGRVIRLFEETTDNSADISWTVTTGWWSAEMPDWEKQLRWIGVYGSSEDDITMTVYVDGDTTTPAYSSTITGITTPTGLFARAVENKNIRGNFYKFVFSGTGVSVIYGIKVILLPVRQIPGIG